MSKAFTREDDGAADEGPIVDDQALPPGVTNYVTPAGAAQLKARIEAMRQSLAALPEKKASLERQIAALYRRLEAAEVIDPLAQPRDRVRFGATVTVRASDGAERQYRLVGIDEADVRRGRVSWRAPVAEALLGRQVGELTNVRTPHGEEELEIVAIDYLID